MRTEEITNDETRDIAIKCVERLVNFGLVKDCIDNDDESEFDVQDIIHDEINKFIGINEMEDY